ncbi:NB-ARC domain-containing protein [Paractinoplanes durhamensis]|uniref:NB-ARC domain-containing protein n=1 Tax=Paractinoplanes durhamensis TaxID=113563 RepID=UPI003625E7A7
MSELERGDFKKVPDQAVIDAYVAVCVARLDGGPAIREARAADLAERHKLLIRLQENAVATSGRSGPPAVGRIPLAAGCYQAREVVDELSAALADSPVVVLSGLGGVGKTQLAADLARRREKAGTLVVWVSAASQESIVDRLAEAGEEYAEAARGDRERAAERFLAWLATTPRRWLVVLDDVSDPEHLRGLRPPVSSPTGRTLITTRLRKAAVAGLGGRPVEIDVFTVDEAERYLSAALRGRLDDDVPGVVADLDRLPLALGQAAAYLLDQNITSGDYRRRFADRTRRLAQLVPPARDNPDEYRATVAATWSLSIEAADAEEPTGLARAVLELASVLGTAIPGWCSAPRPRSTG